MAPCAEVSSEKILFLLKEFLLIRTGYKVYQDRKEGKAITKQFKSAAAINSIFSRRMFNVNPTPRPAQAGPWITEDTILKVKSRQNPNYPPPVSFSRTVCAQVIMVSWRSCNDIQHEGKTHKSRPFNTIRTPLRRALNGGYEQWAALTNPHRIEMETVAQCKALHIHLMPWLIHLEAAAEQALSYLSF